VQLQQSTAVRGERHGLSAQIGAVHAVPMANAAELSLENYILVSAITWHAWHVRWRSVDLASASMKWSPVFYSYLPGLPCTCMSVTRVGALYCCDGCTGPARCAQPSGSPLRETTMN